YSPACDRIRSTKKSSARSAYLERSLIGSGSHDFNIVGLELGIIRQNGNPFDLCLSDQNAIERVVVVPRQFGNAQDVTVLDSERICLRDGKLLGHKMRGR